MTIQTSTRGPGSHGAVSRNSGQWKGSSNPLRNGQWKDSSNPTKDGDRASLDAVATIKLADVAPGQCRPCQDNADNLILAQEHEAYVDMVAQFLGVGPPRVVILGKSQPAKNRNLSRLISNLSRLKK
jgi:hypothetical protein